MEPKNILLMAGAGIIGGYTSQELLRMGHKVTVIALEDLTSFNKNLRYIKKPIDDEMLKEIVLSEHFDCIVDFLHYPNTETYKDRAKFLLENTDQLIFLSSYRVYGDEQHPVTETAPQLLQTCKDQRLLDTEDYAMPKCRNEIFLRNSGYKNWTIVRPLISFAHFRFQLVTHNEGIMVPRLMEHKKTLLPENCRNIVAGFGWGGNVGKELAHLCCNEKALGEDFTLGSGENLTWGQVAEIYSALTGMEFVWVDKKTYMEVATANNYLEWFGMDYDRGINRDVDISKVLRVTGLTKEDMVPIKEALLNELNFLADRPDLVARFKTPQKEILNKQMDEYLKSNNL